MHGGLIAHPGSDSVGISYTASNGNSIWLDPGSRYLVNDNEQLRAELATWLK